ncbi:uncharacterized protein BP5553_02589 [Venustampulla echinocandica]|uniref:Uncharacterized protein n=1 Tax=Venustampulla echinocandica TaxID=2656787 RepID=A0A370TRT4_9HELO|nr:uncharacterized protein BP5553_02589 [Venustampulla echinocandica]RDL38249.1 hypothetical protein BP5553_02589 [Venustampulla echinocandica]
MRHATRFSIYGVATAIDDHSQHDKAVEDEERLSAERRKLTLAPTNSGPTQPCELNQSYRLKPRIIIPPSTAEFEIDDMQAPNKPRNLPTPKDDEQYYTSGCPRTPSTPKDPILVAEYQEWPFHDLLDYTRIENVATYHPRFEFPCILESSNLPIPLRSLSISSNKKTLAPM